MANYVFIIPSRSRNVPIKLVYKEGSDVSLRDSHTIEVKKNVYGTEAEKVISDIFGTTKLGILDCSGMTDEKVDEIIKSVNEES